MTIHTWTRTAAIAAATTVLLLTASVALAQSKLDVTTLTKYLDPLPNLMDDTISPSGTLDGVPLYEIGITQFEQKLHSELQPTTVWGYNGMYPGPTFDLHRDETIKVRWTNNLRDEQGDALDHFLPYDTTVHGAGSQFPQSRTVTHLHGGVNDEFSDGYPEHWFTPDENASANGLGGPAGNSHVTTYVNEQRSSALWYHDHAMGITRLNVYAGLAGIYFIRDDEELAHGLPSGDFEVPLVLQDRSFYDDGQLFYPNGNSPEDPKQVSFFLGDSNLVNGIVWPTMEVEPRKYRFRMLNAANSRSYDLSLVPDAGAAVTNPVTFHQIGTDGGFLSSRVERSSVSLDPADRADIVVDFSLFDVGDTLRLMNDGRGAVAGATDQVMQFRIRELSGVDNSNLPDDLTTIERYREEDAVKTRKLELVRRFDSEGRIQLLLDGKKWTDEISETVVRGELEIWEITNSTPTTHPIHLHLEAFQVLDRRDPFGDEIPLEDHERGWEDTFAVKAGETVRFMVKFDKFAGTFVWHCHILEHEDNEMMRPFKIVMNVVPEPSAWMMVLAGMLSLGVRRRPKRAALHSR